MFLCYELEKNKLGRYQILLLYSFIKNYFGIIRLQLHKYMINQFTLK